MFLVRVSKNLGTACYLVLFKVFRVRQVPHHYHPPFLSYGDILLDCPFIMAALAAGATDVQIICANLC